MTGWGSGLPRIEHLADFGNQAFQRKWFLNEFDALIKDAVMRNHIMSVAGDVDHFHLRKPICDLGAQFPAVHFRHDDIGKE